MRKKIILFFTIITMFLLSACSEKNQSSSSIDNSLPSQVDSSQIDNTISNPKDSSTVSPAQVSGMPKPFGDLKSDTGGDENMEYYSTLGKDLNYLDNQFIQLVGTDTVDKWLEATSTYYNDLVKVSENANLYSFIIHFNIPDETVRNIIVKQREFLISQKIGSEYYLTDKEIDLLLSKDDKAVAKYFVSENAIEKDGKIYSPKWIYTHSIKDYKNEGLSAELINEKVNKFVDKIQFTAEAKKALKDKVKAYSDEMK